MSMISPVQSHHHLQQANWVSQVSATVAVCIHDLAKAKQRVYCMTVRLDAVVYHTYLKPSTAPNVTTYH